jgi:hypothetical protein
MTDAERLLVAETAPGAVADLDEDELLALHTRVRRARTKYVTNYRRRASTTVAAAGGRGLGYERNRRDREKAEVFERALARVSRRIGVVAGRAAAELKAERLAAARSDGAGPGTGGKPAGATPAGRRPAAVKTTGGRKRDASTRAQGQKRQARKDSR